MTTYAEIIDGQINRTRSTTDELLATKLLAHGWLPVEDVAPTYDPLTQYIDERTIDIQADKVVRSRAVHDYTPEQLAVNLANAQAAKMSELYSNVKRFVNFQPNGWPRYDADLKFNIIQASMNGIAAGTGKPANCTAVETWVDLVKMKFSELKEAITAAEDMAELNAIDVSYDAFEAQYGRDGTVAADPAVSTDDLFA